MSYELKFLPSAQKEWRKLGEPLRAQFKKKLAERLENPVVPADRLSGFENHYKIKLRSSGYRLVYEVEELVVTVYIIAVGKRERSEVCRKAEKRSKKPKRD